jgi:hypothetical protein
VGDDCRSIASHNAGRVEAMYWIPTPRYPPMRYIDATRHMGLASSWHGLLTFRTIVLCQKLSPLKLQYPTSTTHALLSSKWRSRKQCVVQHMWSSDSSDLARSWIQYRYASSQSSATWHLAWRWFDILQMDRQEYLTSMGVSTHRNVEALPPTRYIDYGRPLDDIHDLPSNHT